MRLGDRFEFLADAEVETGLAILMRGVLFTFVASQAIHPESRRNHHSFVVLHKRRSDLGLDLHEVNLVSPGVVVSELADDANLADGA